MKRERIDDVLDRCLARIAAGEDVNVCLRDEPEHAAALAPLLQLAVALRHCASLQPAEEYGELSQLHIVEGQRLAALVRAANPHKIIWHRLVRALARIRGVRRRQGTL